MIDHPDDGSAGLFSAYAGMAHISDKASLDALLPNIESLRTKIQQNIATHHWDSEHAIDTWIFSWEQTVFVFKILGLSEAEANFSRYLFHKKFHRVGDKFTFALVEKVLRKATDKRRRRLSAQQDFRSST